MKSIKKLRRSLPGPEQGQSLVEMALTAPILIFMLIGLFEVGWALRSYLVLTNVNREITRFAVRPGYLNFATEADVEASYRRIRDWVETANTGQLDLDVNDEDGDPAKDTLIISHVVVDTGLPCKDIATNPGGCDCDAFVNDPASNPGFELDDIIIHPDVPDMAFQGQRFGPATGVTSRTTQIDFQDLVDDLKPANNRFNCEIIKKGGNPSSNNMIITELFLDQPQLFGFPLISNPYTDPLPLYAHTSMRMINASRSTGSAAGNLTSGISNMGPLCISLPMVVFKDNVPALHNNIDILGGPNGSHPGWLAWDPGWAGNKSRLIDELDFPATSLNSYTDPSDGDDKLNKDDWVASMGNVDINGVAAHVEPYIGQEVVVPVYDTDAGGNHVSSQGGVDSFYIYGFIKVRINAGGVQLGSGQILATYLGEPDGCN